MNATFVPSSSSSSQSQRSLPKLPAHVQKILYVSNLPYEFTKNNYYMYELFGHYGPIRQIRIGTDERKGSAFVVYEDIFDAKEAYDRLLGYNVNNRYLSVKYFNPKAKEKKPTTNLRNEERNKVEIEKLMKQNAAIQREIEKISNRI